MQLITLTSDWGYADQYVGMVKAKLYSLIEDAMVIDITHDVDKYNISQGAFIVRNACLNFPPKTIHIIDINCTESEKNKYQHVVIKYKEQYFICTDNGICGLIFKNVLSEVECVGITNVPQDSSYFTFSALDLFCRVAQYISQGVDIYEMGFRMESLIKLNEFSFTKSGDYLNCSVFYVDSYGNAFLNITIEEFEEVLKGRNFELKRSETKITKISKSYDEVPEGMPLITVASGGEIQIAINRASASDLLGLQKGSQVTFEITN
ncbi:MAG: SAM-dependent chlorinase/fluorinase [Bacteroidales bacterium]|jgi:S-adenosylmethionine hydrolase|nr:SAM-dependent chlorinase/fluorinase [Bacteroidales bacterium]